MREDKNYHTEMSQSHTTALAYNQECLFSYVLHESRKTLCLIKCHEEENTFLRVNRHTGNLLWLFHISDNQFWNGIDISECYKVLFKSPSEDKICVNESHKL